MLNDLKRQVCRANRELGANAHFTWGNVSGFDPSMGLFITKPSGVPHGDLQPELMVVVSLDGQKVEGRLEPSVDSHIHRAIYMAWPFSVSAIAHNHSTYSVAFAQAGLSLPAMGVTHADHFGGPVPITRALREDEMDEKYYENIGKLIVETAEQPERVPAVLLKNHGPFSWGKSPMEAVKTLAILEEIAHGSYLTKMLNPQCGGIDDALLSCHYNRRLAYERKK